MKPVALRYSHLFLFVICFGFASAQVDPEFDKDFTLWERLNNGAVTAFNKSPELYVRWITA